jgi:hypothetical protein
MNKASAKFKLDAKNSPCNALEQELFGGSKNGWALAIDSSPAIKP